MADESSKPITKLKCETSSVVGPVFQEELDELIDDLAESGFALDQNYLECINAFHGAIPITRFFTGGQIERFLNFLDSYTCSRGLRELNANVVRNWLRKAKVRKSLIPFASMPHGAYLCFDYKFGGEPSVVIWNSEVHNEDDALASNFGEFLRMLSKTPPG